MRFGKVQNSLFQFLQTLQKVLCEHLECKNVQKWNYEPVKMVIKWQWNMRTFASDLDAFQVIGKMCENQEMLIRCSKSEISIQFVQSLRINVSWGKYPWFHLPASTWKIFSHGGYELFFCCASFTENFLSVGVEWENGFCGGESFGLTIQPLMTYILSRWESPKE